PLTPSHQGREDGFTLSPDGRGQGEGDDIFRPVLQMYMLLPLDTWSILGLLLRLVVRTRSGLLNLEQEPQGSKATSRRKAK
ncbi:MAG TPA: hypothetical protein VJM51_02655, partial [Dehalococcoidia bacterium]|nr:hypothetical protein [Dehalococcoidia bacterium]